MADISMCANATPHCGKTFQCRRNTDSGTRPSWRQSWMTFPGGKDCDGFWPKSPNSKEA